jgi:hypothetical protein
VPYRHSGTVSTEQLDQAADDERDDVFEREAEHVASSGQTHDLLRTTQTLFSR